ncbi:MAG: arginine N-succinyltransferase [Sphingomicrobium sp.]
MSFRVRAARGGDADAVFEMAKLTGGGFTNLPADRDTLVEKLERSDRSFARTSDEQAGDLYMFVLEDPRAGEIRGTCQIFGKVGVVQPFYSYSLSTLTQSSPELGKTFRNQMLTLTTDLEGTSEVGGLFLHPQARSGGWGALLARSRYLFIKQHRSRFGDHILAELRGVMDDAGNSPFWDGLAGRFFDMSFPEADQFNAIHGTRFIADLMPRTPIYVALLAEAAQAVIGLPHPTGIGALRMLEEEGFLFERYVDIFDGGPTVTAATDSIRTIRESALATVADVAEGGTERMILATGTLHDFVSCRTSGTRQPDGGITIDPDAAEMLGVKPGDQIVATTR